jgi:hypothetical protein
VSANIELLGNNSGRIFIGLSSAACNRVETCYPPLMALRSVIKGGQVAKGGKVDD